NITFTNVTYGLDAYSFRIPQWLWGGGVRLGILQPGWCIIRNAAASRVPNDGVCSVMAFLILSFGRSSSLCQKLKTKAQTPMFFPIKRTIAIGVDAAEQSKRIS